MAFYSDLSLSFVSLDYCLNAFPKASVLELTNSIVLYHFD